MKAPSSPLRDSVLFVEGAPRSGTTALAALLASHPGICGIASESHLFDRGVNLLFDNHEGRHGWRPHLASFITRERLVQLCRNLADGVLDSTGHEPEPSARFVLEKTPAPREEPELTLTRKRECFPDGWYVHIVRDRGQAVESMLRAPWNAGLSRAQCEEWWERGVDAIRSTLGGLERYIEVEYEQLAADPAATVSGVFQWLGLETDDLVLERVSHLATERFADVRPLIRPSRPRLQTAGSSRRRPSLPGRIRRRITAAVVARRTERTTSELINAARVGDREAIERLTEPELEFNLVSHGEVRQATGEQARSALIDAAARAFGSRFVAESWSVSRGDPFAAAIFSGIRGDATRVDLAWAVAVRSGRVARVHLLSAGSLEGRDISHGGRAAGRSA